MITPRVQHGLKQHFRKDEIKVLKSRPDCSTAEVSLWLRAAFEPMNAKVYQEVLQAGLGNATTETQSGK